MTQSAQEMLDLYIQAEKEVLAGKTTVMNGRQYTSENLSEIRAGRKEWEERVAQEQAKASGRKYSKHSLVDFYS